MSGDRRDSLRVLYEELDALEADIAAKQKRMASIRATIDAINKLLDPTQLGLNIPGLDEAPAEQRKGPPPKFSQGQMDVLRLARSNPESYVPPTMALKRSARSLTKGPEPLLVAIVQGNRETGAFSLTEPGKKAAEALGEAPIGAGAAEAAGV